MTDPVSPPAPWLRLVSEPVEIGRSGRPKQLSLEYPERPVLWVLSAEASRGEDLLRSIQLRRPDVFLDLRMVPAFSRMGVSRQEFFGALASCSATYLSLFRLRFEPTGEHHSLVARARSLLEESGCRGRNAMLLLDESDVARRQLRKLLVGDFVKGFSITSGGASLLVSVREG